MAVTESLLQALERIAWPRYDELREQVASWSGLQGFIDRRRSLRDEHNRIMRVQFEAVYLIEELRRRRDGEQPRQIELNYLREAVNEVDPLV